MSPALQYVFYIIVSAILLYVFCRPRKIIEEVLIIKDPRKPEGDEVVKDKAKPKEKYLFTPYHNRVPSNAKLSNVFVPQLGKGYDIESQSQVRNIKKKVSTYLPKRQEK